MVTVEVAFMPCGMLSTDGLIVNTKLPVVLWASLMVKGRTVPLTVNEPNAKVTSRSRALRGTRFLDSIVLHSSELNPCSILSRFATLPVLYPDPGGVATSAITHVCLQLPFGPLSTVLI